MIRTSGKARMHPRNRFRSGYDFPRLIEGSPALAVFVKPNAHGDESIDYANPRAVKALNQALLKDAYGFEGWDVPPGYLCPPIPGRSDYLHYLADLLSGGNEDNIPRGGAVVVLDIGMGASCIYPLIGASEFGWRFVGSEVDPAALHWATALVASHRAVGGLIIPRLQPRAAQCFKGVIKPGEFFHLSMCNPPFHASEAAAGAATRRKRRNLGATRATEGVLNFGGQPGELWCQGGEVGFVQRMIRQSAEVPRACGWFTSLVSQGSHLPRLHQALKEVKAAETRTIEMGQGQKQSRILAWTFIEPAGRPARTPGPESGAGRKEGPGLRLQGHEHDDQIEEAPEHQGSDERQHRRVRILGPQPQEEGNRDGQGHRVDGDHQGNLAFRKSSERRRLGHESPIIAPRPDSRPAIPSADFLRIDRTRLGRRWPGPRRAMRNRPLP